MSEQEWLLFEQEILGIAEVFSALQLDTYSGRPPTETKKELQKIANALGVVLQVLIPLELEHEERQNVLSKAYNWPLVQTLQRAHSANLLFGGKQDSYSANYPTDTVASIRELREAAKKALEFIAVGRGNSERRDPVAALKNDLSKNFVFRYRCRFSKMPPITKSQHSKELELLRRMFQRANVDSNDVAEQLRQAIEKDPMRHSIPGARQARPVKRAKPSDD